MAPELIRGLKTLISDHWKRRRSIGDFEFLARADEVIE
jgi:hypothetical protein